MKKYMVLFSFMLCVVSSYAQSSNNQETSREPKVKVFPNPATSVINILGVQNTQKADIAILDMYGNTVLQHQWQIKNNALNIPISSLRAGIYVIAIRSKEQDLKTKFYKK